MSDFQCKFYLLDGAETFSCKEGDAESVSGQSAVVRIL